MKFNKVVILSLPLFMASQCSVNDQQSSSEVKDFFAFSQTCPPVEALLPAIKNKYKDRYENTSYKKEADTEFFNSMTRIPNLYRSYIFDEYKIVPRVLEWGQGGMTNWGYVILGNKSYRTPSSVEAAWNSLVHEFGHASYGRIHELNPGFEEELAQLFESAVTYGEESHGLHWYAKQNDDEYQAELFAQFYCSDESRKELEERAPKAFKFAKKYFFPPVDIDLDRDSDHDGVSDWIDVCPGSRPNPKTGLFDGMRYTVITEESKTGKSFIGCNPYQLPGKDGKYSKGADYWNVESIATLDQYFDKAYNSSVKSVIFVVEPGSSDYNKSLEVADEVAFFNQGKYKTYTLSRATFPNSIASFDKIAKGSIKGDVRSYILILQNKQMSAVSLDEGVTSIRRIIAR